MQKISVFAGLLVTTALGFSQTVAQDFTKTDCQTGASHHLFDELNAQKVVIMEFVMPCGSCTIGATTLEQIYQEYNFNYPGRILFYGMADNNSTSCNTMNSWASTNSISCTTFINCASDVAYYGGVGMPTVAVVGGGYSHKIFYRKVSFNGPTEDANVRAALDSALMVSNGLQDNTSGIASLLLFPNPVDNSTTVSYTLPSDGMADIVLMDVIGELVMKLSEGTRSAGSHTVDIDCSTLTDGIYFVRLRSTGYERIVKLLLSH